METVDVVVIGAGFAGLSAAKTYLQCCPETDLVLFDDHASIGGVWSLERLYPDLKTNNLLGTFEMPDFPMHKGYGVNVGNHIPGKVVHDYLCDYADHFNLTRRIRLNTRVVSAEKIGGPEAVNAGWSLQVQETLTNPQAGQSTRCHTIACKKLIISTGLTSQPIPRRYIKGEESFCAPIVTSATVAIDAPHILQNADEHSKRITVLGGSKSSYDFVWIFASRGFQVNWIIRKTGFGPAPLLPPYLHLGPLHLRMEKLTCTRALGWLAPCLWSTPGGSSSTFQHRIQAILHRTSPGRSIVKHLWNDIGRRILDQTLHLEPKKPEYANYDHGMHNLLPDENVVWYATKTGVLNYPDSPGHRGGIHSFIRTGKVTIYREDIDHLSCAAVHLADSVGTVLPSPAGLAVATSWNVAPNISFPQKELHSDLGIPSVHYSAAQKSLWHRLDSQANEEILNYLPWLHEAPKGPNDHSKQKGDFQSGELELELTNNLDPDAKVNLPPSPSSPYSTKDGQEPIRLYRFIAPPGLTTRGDHSIVFNGFVSNVANTVRLEISALWCFAYLNGHLAHLTGTNASGPNQGPNSPTIMKGQDSNRLVYENVADGGKICGSAVAREDIYYQAALYNAYTRKRFPYGYGAKIPDFEFEQVPYFDVLLRDLGLSWRRKRNRIMDAFVPYGPRDYRGLVAEWLAMRKQKSE